MNSADALLLGGIAVCLIAAGAILVTRLPPGWRKLGALVLILVVLLAVVLVLALDGAQETSDF